LANGTWHLVHLTVASSCLSLERRYIMLAYSSGLSCCHSLSCLVVPAAYSLFSGVHAVYATCCWWFPFAATGRHGRTAFAPAALCALTLPAHAMTMRTGIVPVRHDASAISRCARGVVVCRHMQRTTADARAERTARLGVVRAAAVEGMRATGCAASVKTAGDVAGGGDCRWEERVLQNYLRACRSRCWWALADIL